MWNRFLSKVTFAFGYYEDIQPFSLLLREETLPSIYSRIFLYSKYSFPLYSCHLWASITFSSRLSFLASQSFFIVCIASCNHTPPIGKFLYILSLMLKLPKQFIVISLFFCSLKIPLFAFFQPYSKNTDASWISTA